MNTENRDLLVLTRARTNALLQLLDRQDWTGYQDSTDLSNVLEQLGRAKQRAKEVLAGLQELEEAAIQAHDQAVGEEEEALEQYHKPDDDDCHCVACQ